MFETRIPRNRASRHDPNVIVSAPNPSRIPFGIVTVFARRMLAYERLDLRGGIAPRAARRRAASTSLSPVGAISIAVTVRRPYPHADQVKGSKADGSRENARGSATSIGVRALCGYWLRVDPAPSTRCVGPTRTARLACAITAEDALPSKADRARLSPREPITMASASSSSAARQIASHVFPPATRAVASKPAACASAAPCSALSRASSATIWSRSSSLLRSRSSGAETIVAGSHGSQVRTGSHTLKTTAGRRPSSSPAFAIAAAASSDPSKHSSAVGGVES